MPKVIKIVLSLTLISTISSPLGAAPKLCGGPLKEDHSKILDLPEGYSYEVLIQTGDKMTDGETFPRDPDLIAYLPLSPNRAFLIISHEIANDFDKIDTTQWKWQGALTRHYLVDGKIKESKVLAGNMINNCSGSLTPWGTVLTVEEYPHEPAEQFPDEGFAWEVDPVTGEKNRLRALGRFSHETAVVAPDGSVYQTEDNTPGFFYRFIPEGPGDLSRGKLFAYKEDGSWIEIKDPAKAPEEAKAKGAMVFYRLEGLDIDPKGKFLYFSATGEKKETSALRFGSIFKMDLKNFRLSVFQEGGPETWMNPDNLVLDQKGNLWVSEDRFGFNVKTHGTNGIWKLDSGSKACLFARLRDPECETTGPSWTPDGKTLFINVMCDEGGKTLKITGF